MTSRLAYAKELYPKIALLKSAYAFTDRAYLHLDADAESYYVSIVPRDNTSPVSAEEFSNEMLCQSVRHEVYTQTKTIRELLVARAMASTVIETDSQALNASELRSEEEAHVLDSQAGYSDESILTDWFDDDNS